MALCNLSLDKSFGPRFLDLSATICHEVMYIDFPMISSCYLST